MRLLAAAGTAALMIAVVPKASAQYQSTDTLAVVPHTSAPELRAAPLVGEIRIDGRLDEPAWQAAAVATKFTQRQPHEGAPVSERTEVRAIISENALYIGARLYDSEPSKIRARLVRRDEVNSSSDCDFVAVLLDPYHDHSTGVIFRVGPAGSVDDATIAASGNQDLSWDPVWHAHATMDSLGWTAEMEIPLSQLHF
ncbi:MAG: carbohydrate binding family 9 domain-containing protein, partial [Candidatus Eiseniibacteriota bacterium]